MPANQIIKGLYVGDYLDAHAAKGKVDVMINVLERPFESERVEGELWIPIARKIESTGKMKASIAALNRVANVIDKSLKKGLTVMIHCAAGMERSNLAVMWYLYTKMRMPLVMTYEFVKSRRPQTQWCLDWLPNYHG